MKTPACEVDSRRFWLFRWLSRALPVLLLAGPAYAQTSPASAPQPGTVEQQTDEDPLGRSTPYGTVRGFLRAADAEDYARAAQYLDTRRKEAAAEKIARQLQAVMDRGLKANLDRISRKPEGDPQDASDTELEKIGTVATRSGKLEILLERVERRGQSPVWLFSSDTLALIPEASEELSGFDLERHLPRILVDTTILSFGIYRWIGSILAIALALGLAGLVTRAIVPLLRRLLRRFTDEEDGRALSSIKAPIRLILVGLAIRLFTTVTQSLTVRQFWMQVSVTVGIIGLAWLVVKSNYIFSEFGLRRLRSSRNLGKIAMYTLARRLFSAAVVVVTALLLLQQTGMDLTAILTGIGIGGIAFALAAQKTLENLFGGIMIITDEPMRVGDFCRVDNLMGTVEDIGIRSTRIRTLSRTVIAVPNGQLATMNIENFSTRDKFWLRHQIGVRYETSSDQLRYLLAGIRGMLYAHPRVERDSARIRFVGFGASSLDLEIFAYVGAVEMAEFLAIQEDILLRIMDIVAQAGTGMAFPSQTTYLAKDSPLDQKKTEEALTRVREWRERGDLPFPDFRPDLAGHPSERIEYPPTGSSLRSDPGSREGK